ncbi:MAG: hypothetical protein ABI648_12675 [Betaproteobacteria bacterium]
MNESIKPNSTGTSTVDVRCVAWFAVLGLANLPGVAFAQSPCPGIHVTVPIIRNWVGTVACALFASPAGFPIEYLQMATNVMAIKIQETQVRRAFVFHGQLPLRWAQAESGHELALVRAWRTNDRRTA